MLSVSLFTLTETAAVGFGRVLFLEYPGEMTEQLIWGSVPSNFRERTEVTLYLLSVKCVIKKIVLQQQQQKTKETNQNNKLIYLGMPVCPDYTCSNCMERLSCPGLRKKHCSSLRLNN